MCFFSHDLNTNLFQVTEPVIGTVQLLFRDIMYLYIFTYNTNFEVVWVDTIFFFVYANLLIHGFFFDKFWCKNWLNWFINHATNASIQENPRIIFELWQNELIEKKKKNHRIYQFACWLQSSLGCCCYGPYVIQFFHTKIRTRSKAKVDHLTFTKIQTFVVSTSFHKALTIQFKLYWSTPYLMISIRIVQSSVFIRAT